MDRRRLLVLPAVFLSLVLLAPAVAQGGVDGPGRTFHVSPSGSDSNPGTESQPWATISRGVASLEPGDVLIVHGGTYHEVIVINVSGTPEAPIEIRAAPGEEVIVDQSGFGSNCLIFAPGASYVRVSGLRLFDCDIWAVSLDGGNSHVELDGLEISGAEVGVHMTTGYSGQEPMHGPVDNVTITNCLIHDNRLAGVDCTPGPCSDVTIRASSIYDNGVQQGFGADGVAAEVGYRWVISWCDIHHNGGDGVDIGSRNPLFPEYMFDSLVDHSLVHHNGMEGVKLWTGGAVQGSAIYGNGLTGIDFVYDGEYLVVGTLVAFNSVENRAYSLSAGYPEPEPLGPQGDLRLQIFNSIFAFNGPPDAPVGIYIGSGVRSFEEDYNIWFSRSDSEIWLEGSQRDVTWDDITSGAWTAETGNGAHSQVADPKFADPQSFDFRPLPDSPAVDAGTLDWRGPDGDLSGGSRVVGSSIDVGPYELGSGGRFRPGALLTPLGASSGEAAGTETPSPAPQVSPSGAGEAGGEEGAPPWGARGWIWPLAVSAGVTAALAVALSRHRQLGAGAEAGSRGRDGRSAMLTALEERYRRGEISEELYRELRRKYGGGG